MPIIKSKVSLSTWPETTYCHTDRRMLCSVLSNLIMNAIQNSSRKEEIRIWCETRDNDRIRLSVLNTNAHIDEETKAKLFEPFYREDKARSSSAECGGSWIDHREKDS